MRDIKFIKNGILINNVNRFNLYDILKSTQTLRWYKENNYCVGFIGNHKVQILFNESKIAIKGITLSDYKKLKTYLHIDYNLYYCKSVILKYPEFGTYVDLNSDIRILNTTIDEIILNAIALYNEEVSRAFRSIDLLCSYSDNNVLSYYNFPSINKLLTYSEDDFILFGFNKKSKLCVNLLKDYVIIESLSYNDLFRRYKDIPLFILQYIALFGLKSNKCFLITDKIKFILNKVYGVKFNSDIEYANYAENKFGVDSSIVCRYLLQR